MHGFNVGAAIVMSCNFAARYFAAVIAFLLHSTLLYFTYNLLALTALLAMENYVKFTVAFKPN